MLWNGAGSLFQMPVRVEMLFSVAPVATPWYIPQVLTHPTVINYKRFQRFSYFPFQELYTARNNLVRGFEHFIQQI